LSGEWCVDACCSGRRCRRCGPGESDDDDELEEEERSGEAAKASKSKLGCTGASEETRTAAAAEGLAERPWLPAGAGKEELPLALPLFSKLLLSCAKRLCRCGCASASSAGEEGPAALLGDPRRLKVVRDDDD
jgi:hypothetical protein